MMQLPIPQAPQCQAPIIQPSYNAVKIDIHNPQVNAPVYAQKRAKEPTSAPITAPIYSYPQSQVYDVPNQSIYSPTPPTAAVATPPAVKEIPSVPPPVIVPQTTVTTAASIATPTTPPAVPNIAEQPVIAPVIPEAATAKVEEAKAAEVKAPEVAPTTKVEVPTPTAAPVEVAPAQTVDVKTPEVVKPQIDVNEFISKLTNPDYEVQATTMESIANLAQSSPEKASALLDVKIIDTLLGIMQADTSKLAGPTPQQLQIREKIMSGKPVTEAETADANTITPMESAERNKQYSIYTVAILQKLYGSEIEKLNSTVVPLTELPGAAGIVEQVKSNPNPMVRASALDALSYIQRPEYKQDLTTLFTVAQKDKDVNVQNVATKALEKLAKVAEAPATPTSAITTPADAKPEEKKVV